jgi:hypothetical protein
MSHYLKIDSTDGCPEQSGFRAAVARAFSSDKKGATLSKAKNDEKSPNPAVVFEIRGKISSQQINALNEVFQRFHAGVQIVSSIDKIRIPRTTLSVLSDWKGKGSTATVADAIDPALVSGLASRLSGSEPRYIAA